MGHNHSHENESGKNLRTAFLLNICFTIFEIIGGFYVNSVAIISDAVHDLGDSISLGISWYLDKKSKQVGNKKFSFGYKRFSLLGALINSLVLIGGSVYVIYEAINRLIEPELSDANGMIVFDDTREWNEELALYRHIVDCSGDFPLLEKAEVEYLEVPQSEPLKNECQHFFDIVRDNFKPLTDGDEGLSVLKVLSAASLSQSKNEAVRLSLL